MNSHASGMDIDIEVRRRDNNYILIARRFGAIARSKELESGSRNSSGVSRSSAMTSARREFRYPPRFPASATRVRNEVR